MNRWALEAVQGPDPTMKGIIVSECETRPKAFYSHGLAEIGKDQDKVCPEIGQQMVDWIE